MNTTKLDNIFTLGVVLLALLGNCLTVQAEPTIAWSGNGKHRLLVQVLPRKLAGRPDDELPAELAIDFQKELRKLGLKQLVDLSTLQIVRYDSRTGQAISDGNYAYGKSDPERPFRWYDAAIPYEFPEFANAASRTEDKIVRRSRVRGGYFFNAIGDWRKGRLAWLHRQVGEQPSHYAIYFDLLGEGEMPGQLPPRGWLGDGLPRCDKTSHSTMGADHCRIDLDDWNDDGLVDLIVGEHYGHVFWWPNLGSRKQPVFRYSKFVSADGQPLDAGIAAAPKVVDWNGDGIKDLLVGTHWNRLLYFENKGSNRERKLEYRGPVRVEGKTLELPLRPLHRGSLDVFKRDYYPVPETVDWDGDGDLDLLLGGYITGLIFFYENQGQGEDGTPRLRLHGPISTSAGALNVGHWCASPCVADFDDDGDWDLMSGNMPMHVQPTEREKFANTFLQFFAGDGGTQRVLQASTFPGVGDFPRERLATPRSYDWDDDGDLDMVVSARENIYFYENQGTKRQPRFQLHAKPLTVPWGLAPIAVDQFRDWNGDGRLDLIRGYTVKLNSGRGNPFQWEKTESVLPRGEHISHPSGIGDDWFWPYLNDFDSDQDVDVLFGDWHGHVWFHRNESTKVQRRFDLKGFQLRLTDGEVLKVGPLNKDPDKDFDALQGARTVLTAADFDRDGRRDLVVGDTYGKIRYFRNADKTTSDQPVFDSPVQIGELGIRGLVDSTDWNQDGWADVIASAANGRVRVFLNLGDKGGSRFADGFDPELPPIVQPRVLMADINGDGDEDLFLPSTQGACFVERSFLAGGYAQAMLLATESKK
jgi:hypothetical protein